MIFRKYNRYVYLYYLYEIKTTFTFQILHVLSYSVIQFSILAVYLQMFKICHKEIYFTQINFSNFKLLGEGKNVSGYIVNKLLIPMKVFQN